MRVYPKKSGRAAWCVIATWRTRLLGTGTISFPSENKGPPVLAQKAGLHSSQGCMPAGGLLMRVFRVSKTDKYKFFPNEEICLMDF